MSIDGSELKRRSLAELRALVERGTPYSRRLLQELKQDSRAGAQALYRLCQRAQKKLREEKRRLENMLLHEKEALANGFSVVAGVDEAGRGPYAGPIVAAAVVLKEPVAGVNDSKQLVPEEREELYQRIWNGGHWVGVSVVDVDVINEQGIQVANYMAMAQAVEQLNPQPDFLLVDGFRIPGVRQPQKHLIKGDSLSQSIAAASIVAKVTRDRIMNNVTGRRDRINLNLNPLAPAAEASIAVLETRGAQVTRPLAPGDSAASCAPADAAEDPIPISISLLHGEASVPDDLAYVVVFFGEAFPVQDLGDPRQPAAVLNGSQRPYSEAIADAAAFLLGEEPFTEYAEYLKIYRVDLISRDNRPTDLRTDPPTQRDTALRFGRRSSGFDYSQPMMERLATNCGIDWDKLSVLVNGEGSGTEAAGTVVFSNVTASRRLTALHEFGHGIGNLADEYEYRHGTNPPASLPPATVTNEPNVVATGDRIPLLAEIPWRHWLEGVVCDELRLGQPVDFDCVQTEENDCQCDPVDAAPECVPLPSCEPGGDFIDVDGAIYGRPEWPEPGDLDAVVGLYEGAKYRHKGAFRPELRCRMRSIDDVAERALITPRFCTVCREALVAAMVSEAGHARHVSPQPGAVTAEGTTEFSVQLRGKTSGQQPAEILGWSLDGAPMTNAGATVFSLNAEGLSAGLHTLRVIIQDPTPWVHPNNAQGQEDITQQIEWTLSRP